MATAGVARNANKYLGLRADFIFANLPLRDSVLQNAPATGDNNNLYALTLDPIINIPVSKKVGGYILFGPGFYHRAGSLSGDTTVPGSGCSPFWAWWGACTGGVSIPVSGDFLHSNQSAFGYNFGAGVTRKMPSGVEIYAEARLITGRTATSQPTCGRSRSEFAGRERRGDAGSFIQDWCGSSKDLWLAAATAQTMTRERAAKPLRWNWLRPVPPRRCGERAPASRPDR